MSSPSSSRVTTIKEPRQMVPRSSCLWSARRHAPFSTATGLEGHMDVRLCVPNMSSWSTIPTHYYAQCQTMLATGADVQHLPARSSATMPGAWAYWSGWRLRPRRRRYLCRGLQNSANLQFSRADACRVAYVRELTTRRPRSRSQTT